jgi:hypothetical protein
MFFSTSYIPDRGSHDSYTDQTLRVPTPLLNVSKIYINFFASFVDIFNQVVVPNRVQVTHHKSTHVFFYIVYCVYYEEVKNSYVTLTCW